MDKSKIIREIKLHLGFKNDTELADFLGIKQNTLSTWKSRNTMDYDLVISKCDFIDANWLLTGEGKMLKSELNEQKFSNNDKYTASLEKINALQEDKIANLEKTIKELKSKLQKTIAKQENDIINLQGEDLSAMKSPNLPPDDPLQPSRKV